MLLSGAVKQRALEVGFDLVGIAPPSAAKDLEFLPPWIKKGFGGEMGYLANPRREDPRRVLPSVKSIICAGLIYNTPFPYSTEIAGINQSERDLCTHDSAGGEDQSRGWISRYAWGRDYHKIMRGKLEGLRTTLEKMADGVETRVFVDTGPIMERAFARLSGIGWMGKNTCVINQDKGSWLFLGVILTSLELDLDLPAPDRCGSCTRCIDACPTGALVEPYVMNASRCIAYLNIELRGSIPEEFRTAIGENVFGCDICQDVCPWNNRPLSAVRGPLYGNATREEDSGSDSGQRFDSPTAHPEFQPLQVEIKSSGPMVGSEDELEHATKASFSEPFSLFNPTLEDLASITEDNFKRIFAHSPIKRTKYRGWVRNLCVVMGNSGNRRFIPWLEVAAGNPDSVVKEHAAWALRRLQGGVS